MKSLFMKRMGAFILDIIFVYLLISLISGIEFLNPHYNKYVESLNSYAETLKEYTNKEIDNDVFIEKTKESYYNTTKYGVANNIITVVVLIGYFGLFQKYNKGQTLGKKITKIKVVSLDDKEVSLIKMIIRSIPMYFVLAGNILSIVVSTILIFILNKESFFMIDSVVSYLILFINIISIVMMIKGELHRGIHDSISGTKVIME